MKDLLKISLLLAVAVMAGLESIKKDQDNIQNKRRSDDGDCKCSCRHDDEPEFVYGCWI